MIAGGMADNQTQTNECTRCKAQPLQAAHCRPYDDDDDDDDGGGGGGGGDDDDDTSTHARARAHTHTAVHVMCFSDGAFA